MDITLSQTRRAAALSAIFRAVNHTVGDILSMRLPLKVTGIDARAIPAEVGSLVFGRRRLSVNKLAYYSVGIGIPALPSGSPVPFS